MTDIHAEFDAITSTSKTFATHATTIDEARTNATLIEGNAYTMGQAYGPQGTAYQKSLAGLATALIEPMSRKTSWFSDQLTIAAKQYATNEDTSSSTIKNAGGAS